MMSDAVAMTNSNLDIRLGSVKYPLKPKDRWKRLELLEFGSESSDELTTRLNSMYPCLAMLV